MSQKITEGSFDNRPLPKPPSDNEQPKEEPGLLFNDRYSYFKGEIQKWKSSIKHGNNIFTEDLNTAIPSFVQQEEEYNQLQSNNVPYKNILEDIDSSRTKKDQINPLSGQSNSNQTIRQNQNSINKDFQKAYNSKQSHVDKHCERHSDSHSKHYNSASNKENIKPFNEILNKNLQKINQGKNQQQDAKKKISIPKNLNIKEEQLSFFSDLQNVLTQFSELKSRIEKLSDEKVELAAKNDLLQKNCEHIEKELKGQESSHSMLSQQCKILQTNEAKFQKENKYQKEREVTQEEQNKDLLEKSDFLQNENNAKQEQVKQLNIDISVLKNIMKEMVIKDNMTDHSGDCTYNDNSCNYSNDNSHSFIVENPSNGPGLSPNNTSSNLWQSFGENNCFI